MPSISLTYKRNTWGSWPGVLRRKGRRRLDWVIPLIYSAAAVVLGAAIPRLERRYLPHLVAPMPSSVAIAIDSSVASGMLALTGIVFALAFVMVQFGALAYSPRLVSWISRDRLMMHAIGAFTATFLYALAALAWVDRLGIWTRPVSQHRGSRTAGRGERRDLRRHSCSASSRYRCKAFSFLWASRAGRSLRTFTRRSTPRSRQSLRSNWSGSPSRKCSSIPAGREPSRALDFAALFDLACQAGAIVEVVSAVGDTIGEGIILLRVYGGRRPIDESKLIAAFILGDERTFEQDPKYAIFLLVDIAMRALSPAVNDPATAVQALDQIEDLLLRLARRRLEIGGLPRLRWRTPVGCALSGVGGFSDAGARGGSTLWRHEQACFAPYVRLAQRSP